MYGSSSSRQCRTVTNSVDSGVANGKRRCAASWLDRHPCWCYKAIALEGGVLFPVYQRTAEHRERVRVALNFAYFFWLD